jgi:hypothetical protein
MKKILNTYIINMEFIGLALITALFIITLLWLAPKIYSILGEWASLIYWGIALYPLGGEAFYLPFSTILITGVITIFVSFRLFLKNEKKMAERIPNEWKKAEWAARFQSSYMWIHIIVLVIRGVMEFI